MKKNMQFSPYLWPNRLWTRLWGRYHVPQNVFVVGNTVGTHVFYLAFPYWFLASIHQYISNLMDSYFSLLFLAFLTTLVFSGNFIEARENLNTGTYHTFSWYIKFQCNKWHFEVSDKEGPSPSWLLITVRIIAKHFFQFTNFYLSLAIQHITNKSTGKITSCSCISMFLKKISTH